MPYEGLIGRLENWKFTQAHIVAETALPLSTDLPIAAEDRTLIVALAETFGNAGWFEGHLGVIVGTVVEGLVARLKTLEAPRA